MPLVVVDLPVKGGIGKDQVEAGLVQLGQDFTIVPNINIGIRLVEMISGFYFFHSFIFHR